MMRWQGTADLRSAQPAEGGRKGRTPSSRMVRLSAGTPAFSVIRRLRGTCLSLRSAQRCRPEVRRSLEGGTISVAGIPARLHFHSKRAMPPCDAPGRSRTSEGTENLLRCKEFRDVRPDPGGYHWASSNSTPPCNTKRLSPVALRLTQQGGFWRRRTHWNPRSRRPGARLAPSWTSGGPRTDTRCSLFGSSWRNGHEE